MIETGTHTNRENIEANSYTQKEKKTEANTPTNRERKKLNETLLDKQREIKNSAKETYQMTLFQFVTFMSLFENKANENVKL